MTSQRLSQPMNRALSADMGAWLFQAGALDSLCPSTTWGIKRPNTVAWTHGAECDVGNSRIGSKVLRSIFGISLREYLAAPCSRLSAKCE